MNFNFIHGGSFSIRQFTRQCHSQRGIQKLLQKHIVPLKMLKFDEPVSGSIEYGDMGAFRRFEWDADSLNSRGFLRFQKDYEPPNNARETIITLARSITPQLNQAEENSILKYELVDSKLKFQLLSEAFMKFGHSIPNSMLCMMKTIMNFAHLYNVKTKTIVDDKVKQSTNPATVPKIDPSIPSVGSGGKKRAKRKTTGSRFIGDEIVHHYDTKNTFPVVAYATCEELDLEGLHEGLCVQDLYIPTVLSDDMEDVIHVSAKYKISDEPREIFFFREGSVVFWNMPELECVNVLKFIKTYEHESYDAEQVTQELEFLHYLYNEQGSTRLSRGRILLNVESGNKILEKYAFANALASSVKLGIWESTLDRFVDSIAHITEELKRAENLQLSRKEVLQKTGELFSLRHELNLNSDLLDIPDFYWERERLESLYQTTCNYLNIGRRTKVLNEKLAQCCELLELISTHLSDQHHTRLEWMIIALITIEVGFEILHVVERYFY